MEHRRLAKGCRADDHVTDCRIYSWGTGDVLALHPASPAHAFFHSSVFRKKAQIVKRGLDGAQFTAPTTPKKQWASSRSHFSPAPRLAGSIISRRGWNF